MFSTITKFFQKNKKKQKSFRVSRSFNFRRYNLWEQSWEI